MLSLEEEEPRQSVELNIRTAGEEETPKTFKFGEHRNIFKDYWRVIKENPGIYCTN